MFVPFVGIGKEEFPFPRKLAGLPGRPIDLAGFVPVNNLDAIQDLKLRPAVERVPAVAGEGTGAGGPVQ